MNTEVDARLLNWRFIVPSEPEGLLLLPGGAETVPGSVILSGSAPARTLPERHYPAIAVPDLGAWVLRRRPSGAARLLTTLADAVAPGGWLCAGFPNRWYPAAPLRAGSLSLVAAAGVMRRAGLDSPELYAALPDQRRPAFLVPLARPAEMEHMLRVLFDVSFPSSGRGTLAFRRVLSAARRAALAAPHARRYFVPAYYLVARRPR
jgi:hypothetical protein